MVQVADLQSKRRRFADQIRRTLWKQHRLQLSDALCSGFATVPREAFLADPPWVVRGTPKSPIWRQIAKRCAPRLQPRDWTTNDPKRLYDPDVAVAIDLSR